MRPCILLILVLISSSNGFIPTSRQTNIVRSHCRYQSSLTILQSVGDDDNNNGNKSGKGNGFLQGFQNFLTELDNFMDDASARRLGNGAAFYGKRKSNFYGKNDKNKKENAFVSDPTEDYQAPATGGYFQWMPDENGEMRPVTRLKKQNIERNPQYWDRFYDKEENKNK